MIFFTPLLTLGQGNVQLNNNYFTGDDIKVLLLKNAQGIENGIANRSEGATLAGLKFLGAAGKPGIYRVDFVFTPSLRETYNILILPKVPGLGFSANAVPSPTINTRYTALLTALNNYSADHKSLKPILNQAAAAFIKKHVVDGPVSLVACLAAIPSGANPIFVITCKSTAVPIAKDLVICVLEAANEQLYQAKYLSPTDYSYFKDQLKFLNFAISLANAEGIYDALLATADFSANADQENLIMGADYGGQLYKKYEFILKFKPK
jgi:hypothetical protein